MTSQPLTDDVPECTRATGNCFAAGTLVRTPCGMFPIERLVAGDEVITEDGMIARIAIAHRATSRELVKVWTSARTSVVTTPWHRFFDLQGDLCHAERLRDAVVRGHIGPLKILRVDRKLHAEPVPVHNLSLERGVSFFANGMLAEAPNVARVLAGRSLLKAS